MSRSKIVHEEETNGNMRSAVILTFRDHLYVEAHGYVTHAELPMHDITFSGPCYDPLREPKVNWSGIGAVSVAQAKAYAEAIAMAAHLAQELEARYPRKSGHAVLNT